jgi:hypothetical protein
VAKAMQACWLHASHPLLNSSRENVSGLDEDGPQFNQLQLQNGWQLQNL